MKKVTTEEKIDPECVAWERLVSSDVAGASRRLQGRTIPRVRQIISVVLAVR